LQAKLDKLLNENQAYLVEIEDLKFENSEQKIKLNELEKALTVSQNLKTDLATTKGKLAQRL
jgi:hypothetical protein